MKQPTDSLVPVTPEELRKALTVWIVTAPKRMWLDYWHHAETAGKWSAAVDGRNRYDPRAAMAEYLAGKLEQGGWSVAQPARGGAFTHERRVEDEHDA